MPVTKLTLNRVSVVVTLPVSKMDAVFDLFIVFPVWAVRPRNTRVKIHGVTRISIKLPYIVAFVGPFSCKGVVRVITRLKGKGLEVVNVGWRLTVVI